MSSIDKDLKSSSVFPFKNTRETDPNLLVNHMEDLLDQLDTYRSCLSNQHLSMDMVKPQVAALNAAKSRLALRGYHLSEENPLKAIMNDVIQITAQEINRFEKGCYKGILKSTDGNSIERHDVNDAVEPY